MMKISSVLFVASIFSLASAWAQDTHATPPLPTYTPDPAMMEQISPTRTIVIGSGIQSQSVPTNSKQSQNRVLVGVHFEGYGAPDQPVYFWTNLELIAPPSSEPNFNGVMDNSAIRVESVPVVKTTHCTRNGVGSTFPNCDEISRLRWLPVTYQADSLQGIKHDFSISIVGLETDSVNVDEENGNIKSYFKIIADMVSYRYLQFTNENSGVSPQHDRFRGLQLARIRIEPGVNLNIVDQKFSVLVGPAVEGTVAVQAPQQQTIGFDLLGEAKGMLQVALIYKWFNSSIKLYGEGGVYGRGLWDTGHGSTTTALPWGDVLEGGLQFQF